MSSNIQKLICYLIYLLYYWLIFFSNSYIHVDTVQPSWIQMVTLLLFDPHSHSAHAFVRGLTHQQTGWGGTSAGVGVSILLKG